MDVLWSALASFPLLLFGVIVFCICKFITAFAAIIITVVSMAVIVWVVGDRVIFIDILAVVEVVVVENVVIRIV